MNCEVDTAKALLSTMLRIRMTEQAIAERYPRQEMRCPVHLCVGQEAVPAGVCAALDRSDLIMSTHRAHGHYLAKGGSLPAMLAEIYGRETGCCGGRGGSMHLLDMHAGFMGSTSIVGGSIPLGAGLAFGALLGRTGQIAAVFFGDAATEEGVFAETLNFAAQKKLPLLFVCEDNQYSTITHRRERRPESFQIADLARCHGIPSFQGNGNDALEVLDLATDAAERIRAGEGPVFLEFSTYRWLEHCGPNCDHEAGLRPLGDLGGWKTSCPIDGLAAKLIDGGALDQETFENMRAVVAEEIRAAFEFAMASPFPDPGGVLDRVYADPNGVAR